MNPRRNPPFDDQDMREAKRTGATKLRKIYLSIGLMAFVILVFMRATPTHAQEINLLGQWMTGTFSSAAQARADTNYLDIRIEMVRIWKERTDGIWIYVEQAAITRLDRPHLQRVYHITGPIDGVYTIDVFTMPDPMRYVGQGRNKDALADLDPGSLILRDGCAVSLRRQDISSFAGGTMENNCQSSLRGASYATSEVTITYDRIVSWDRGFNEEGEQVWGAREGGYVFLRTRYN